MYIARMICSDPECATHAVVEATDVMELATALCECGCVLDTRGLPDWVDVEAPPALPVHPPALRLAA